MHICMVCKLLVTSKGSILVGSNWASVLQIVTRASVQLPYISHAKDHTPEIKQAVRSAVEKGVKGKVSNGYVCSAQRKG